MSRDETNRELFERFWGVGTYPESFKLDAQPRPGYIDTTKGDAFKRVPKITTLE